MHARSVSQCAPVKGEGQKGGAPPPGRNTALQMSRSVEPDSSGSRGREPDHSPDFHPKTNFPLSPPILSPRWHGCQVAEIPACTAHLLWPQNYRHVFPLLSTHFAARSPVSGEQEQPSGQSMGQGHGPSGSGLRHCAEPSTNLRLHEHASVYTEGINPELFA